MISVRDITIDKEFESLIPALSDDERFGLMTVIGRDGFRDPLVVWLNHGILIDGHHRFRIWEASFQDDENREPSIVEMKFSSREDVIEWIAKNQLNRRNLTDAQRIKVALKLKPSIEKKAKANQQAAGGTVPTKTAKAIDTRKEIAKQAKVSPDQVSKYEHVVASGNQEVVAAMDSGKKKVGTAFREVSPKPVDPPSSARQYVDQAITILKRIRDDDDQRTVAVEYLEDWIVTHFHA